MVVLTDTLAVAFSNETQRDKALSDAKRLINGPVDVNSRSHGGLTPLHIAIASDNAGVLQCLLDQGADPLEKTALGPGPEHQLDAYRYTVLLSGHSKGQNQWRIFAPQDIWGTRRPT